MSELLNEAQRSGNLPAIGLLVKKNDATVSFETLGKRSLQHTAPVHISDKWHLGSDTKAMTAFLVALAIQEKKLSFDSNIAGILASEKTTHIQNRNLKVKDLLSQSSGLKDVQEVKSGQFWRELFKSQKPLRQQRIEMTFASLAEPPLKDPKDTSSPNRRFRYTNINYIILGALLEKIYNEDWESLIQKRLFDPLGMSSCGFGVAGDPLETEPSQPWPHLREKGQQIGVSPKHKLDNPPMLGPAGTVHCNLVDWNKFITDLTHTWHGKGLLLKDLEVAKIYFMNASGSRYTYGGWIREDKKHKTPILSHNGSNTFNYAIAVIAPEKEAIIQIVTNTGTSDAEKALSQLQEALMNTLLTN